MIKLKDYLYANEVLELPEANSEYSTMHEEEALTFDMDYQHLMVEVEAHIQSWEQEEVPYRFWYRWITGHQAMFILWYILSTDMKEAATKGAYFLADRLDAYARILEGCAALFDYTGSCPADFYNEQIRTYMALYHKGFSGQWSSDYTLLPKLIRKIMTTEFPDNLQEKKGRFKTAYLLHQKVHYGVADKLVPNGKSLLKNAKQQGGTVSKTKPEHFMMYDFFFLVHRTPVSKKRIFTSLEKRVKSILSDVRAHPVKEPALLKHDANKLIFRAVQGVFELLSHPIEPSKRIPCESRMRLDNNQGIFCE